MKLGDVVINPYVEKLWYGKPNPMYKTMIIHIGRNEVKTLAFDMTICDFPTHHVSEWKICRNVDFDEFRNFMDKGE